MHTKDMCENGSTQKLAPSKFREITGEFLLRLQFIYMVEEDTESLTESAYHTIREIRALHVDKPLRGNNSQGQTGLAPREI